MRLYRKQLTNLRHLITTRMTFATQRMARPLYLGQFCQIMDILHGPNIANATQAASKSMAWQWADTGWALTIGGGRVRWAFQEFWCGLYIVKSECIYYFEEADAIKIMPKAKHAKGRCSFPFLVRWVYSMQSMSIVD
ncbi:uncharacterized protein LOC119275101 isoform X1 [Triticum dicoccoides]|uniref:uncharacterized protein LOC119275101 isoform X1 n=1 Tax=Triticum dicoccoides TaxID=85692 RepID=UPI00188E3D91|nr:uncharacterized protein LOC119275101 isoform X1 [Triticum dicoccoides]